MFYSIWFEYATIFYIGQNLKFSANKFFLSATLHYSRCTVHRNVLTTPCASSPTSRTSWTPSTSPSGWTSPLCSSRTRSSRACKRSSTRNSQRRWCPRQHWCLAIAERQEMKNWSITKRNIAMLKILNVHWCFSGNKMDFAWWIYRSLLLLFFKDFW